MPQPIYALKLVLMRVDRDESDQSILFSENLLVPLDGKEAQIVWTSEITKTVTRKLWEKQLKGAVEHGSVMSAHDGKVNALVESQAEALDLAQYLEKLITEGKDD
jgi:hypothetical protein